MRHMLRNESFIQTILIPLLYVDTHPQFNIKRHIKIRLDTVNLIRRMKDPPDGNENVKRLVPMIRFE